MSPLGLISAVPASSRCRYASSSSCGRTTRVVAVSPCLTAFWLTFLFPFGVLGPVLLAAFLLLASILRCDVIGVHSAWQDVGDVRRGIASILAASLPPPGVRP